MRSLLYNPSHRRKKKNITELLEHKMNTFNRTSSMRQAFENATIKQDTSSRLVRSLVMAAGNGAGIKREREWNAHLKFSTYNRLHGKGDL